MWTFGGIRVIVQAIPENLKQIIARLQPVQGKTVHQVFGYESPVVRLKAYVVGDDDKDALDEYYRDGLAHTLSGYAGVIDDFLVSSMTFDLQKPGYQTIRPELDCESPVYIVDMELYRDL